jgi:hypothetical protein
VNKVLFPIAMFLIGASLVAGISYASKDKETVNNPEIVQKVKQVETKPTQQPETVTIAPKEEQKSTPAPKTTISPKPTAAPNQPVPIATPSQSVEPIEPQCDDSKKKYAIDNENYLYGLAERDVKVIYDSAVSKANRNYNQCQSSPRSYNSSYSASYDYALEKAQKEYDQNMSDINQRHTLNLGKINSTCY